MTPSRTLAAGALLTGLAVALGAFGAHGLEARLEASQSVDTWETAVRYQAWHGLGLIALGLVGMGLNHALWGFVFYFAICLGRGLNGPILNHLQQRLIPSRDRASLLSINSMLFRFSFFLLGPVLGMGVDRFGEHSVLLLAGFVAFPLSVAGLLWFRSATIKGAQGAHPAGPAP